MTSLYRAVEGLMSKDASPKEDPPVSLVGRKVAFEWALSQSAVDRFGLTVGEEHPIHSDERAARESGLPGTIAQGTFLVALSGNAAARFFKSTARGGLAYGYDRVRFTRPVATNEVVAVQYEIIEHDLSKSLLRAQVRIENSRGELVMTAVHLAKIY
jgi:acyl dehydratase